MSKVQLQGNVSGTGVFTIASPNSNTDRTLTLPDNSGTILTQNSQPSFASTIGVGGATPAASGAGITFPATQSASSNANTLDDYEEGTYTATMTTTVSGTITLNPSINTLKYTKIGNAVTIQGRVSISAVSSPIGNVQISLPFLPTSGSGGQSDYMCFNVYTHAVDLDPSAVSIFAEANGTINTPIFQVRDNASWIALNAASLTGSGNEYFYMIGTYMAA